MATFKSIIKGVELHIRHEGPDVKERIKQYLNDAVLTFMRRTEWTKLQAAQSFTTDDSGSYSLSTLIPDDYIFTIRNLIKDGTGLMEDSFHKVEYYNYVRDPQKSMIWSLHGQSVYLTGTGGDFTIFYQTPGLSTVYPMSDDDDEPTVLVYYSDIIKQIAIVRYLVFIGDDESAKIENAVLDNMIDGARRADGRERNDGKLLKVSSHNR